MVKTRAWPNARMRVPVATAKKGPSNKAISYLQGGDHRQGAAHRGLVVVARWAVVWSKKVGHGWGRRRQEKKGLGHGSRFFSSNSTRHLLQRKRHHLRGKYNIMCARLAFFTETKVANDFSLNECCADPGKRSTTGVAVGSVEQTASKVAWGPAPVARTAYLEVV